MAVTFVSVGAIASDITGAASLTPTPPTHVANDILIAAAWNEGGSKPTTATAGWNEITTGAGTADATRWRKRATGAGTAGPTITAADTDCFGIVAVYRGCWINGTPIVDATTSGDGTTTDTTPDTALITTTGDNQMAVAILCHGDDIAFASGNPPATWTNDGTVLSSDGTDGGFTFMSKTVAAAGNVSAVSFGTWSAGEAYWAVTFALIPETSPTVALNTPADAGSISDSTPTFDFTGTDANGDDIRYNILVTQSDNLLTGLTAYWKIDEGTGTNVNDEVGTDDGTITSATWTTGKISNCLDFSGSLQYVTLGNASNTTMSSSAWTISYWFNKDSNPSSILAAIIANDNSSGVRQFSMGLNTSGQFYFERNGTGVSSGGTTFSNGTWYHVVVTYDGTNVKSYVDGSSSANTSNAMSALLSTANNLYFGRRQYSGSEKYFDGRLDEVGIRDRVLSTTEIAALYNSGSGLGYDYLGTVFLNEVSGTDSGFANPDNGGDTDPFTSGENIQFTVQGGDALSDGTYYRKVRGIDPSGSNTYGAFTTARSFTLATTSAAVTGTATASISETDIVAGGKTIIITLTGDTFIAAGTGPIGSTANTQSLIDNIDSAQSEAAGWDAVVKPGIETTDVVRTSDTVATITLDAEATYNITATETITVTVPAAVLTGGVQIVATPTFTVSHTVTESPYDPFGMMGVFGV